MADIKIFLIRIAVSIALIPLSLLGEIPLAKAQTAAGYEKYSRPNQIPFPESNPYTRTKATLGKMLFFDPRVSRARNMNCVSCHNPSFGWEVPTETAIGAQNTALRRHAPAVANLAWSESFFWDGRAATLEEQAAGPISAHEEMDMPLSALVGRIDNIAAYRVWFERAFPGEGVSAETILKAIATYERTIVSQLSPFDHWVRGDDNAISQSAKRGFRLFEGKADCVRCHSGWNFTDGRFHDVGVETSDIGRAGVDGLAKSRFRFKTPSLRNLSQRAPYMHNGSIATIDAVIDHYSSGGVERRDGASDIAPIELNSNEHADLIAFLKTLDTGPDVVAVPLLPN